uniref:Uncharacterized protein n=1 Tax=Anguilla anguilla TaxID=7936 RepID=A0A0E9VLR1_ANGAN
MYSMMIMFNFMSFFIFNFQPKKEKKKEELILLLKD